MDGNISKGQPQNQPQPQTTATSITRPTVYEANKGMYDPSILLYFNCMYLQFVSIFSINIMEIILSVQDLLVFLSIVCKSGETETQVQDKLQHNLIQP